ncbi:MAG: hypothetical protein RMY36_014410 [Nostoc sp. SerVER01]|nr:hypothetical protein [Nostoc sp. DcaGUA01]
MNANDITRCFRYNISSVPKFINSSANLNCFYFHESEFGIHRFCVGWLRKLGAAFPIKALFVERQQNPTDDSPNVQAFITNAQAITVNPHAIAINEYPFIINV